jgi:hypothetical protein
MQVSGRSQNPVIVKELPIFHASGPFVANTIKMHYVILVVSVIVV